MVACLILNGTLGCGLFSNKTDELVLPPTEAGTPVGDKVSNEIGPAGGTLSSSDGRLTLTVPPNAVSESVSFSIQPISNNVEDGVGLAYRLEPSGKVFNNPLELSIRYVEKDVEGTFPQALRIAYQDKKGAWHEQSSASLDTANQRVTVSTTHLSDWSFYMGEYVKIIPAKADVRVGKSVKLTVKSCQFNYWSDWLLNGRKKVCQEKGWGSDNPKAWTLKGPGQLAPDWPRIIYTAPARQPKPNVVTVTYHVALFPQDIADLEAKIRIIGRGYRATGTSGGMSFSGTICSLDQPFTIKGNTQLTFNFNFTPTSATAGTIAIGGGGMGISIGNGGGTYQVTGVDTDNPKIALTGNFTGSYPGAGSAAGGGTRYIDLVPFDTDECGETPPTPKPGPIAPPQLKGKGPF
jgi:hypothetical protein